VPSEATSLTTVTRMSIDGTSEQQGASDAPLASIDAPSIWEWVAEERAFAANRYRGTGVDDDVAVLRGTKSLLLTAPHATLSPRDGRIPFPDAGTGGLVVALGRALEVTAAFTTGPSLTNPNRDLSHPLKALVSSEVVPGRTCLDIHAMRDSHGPDFEVGLGLAACGDSHRLANVLAGLLTASGYDVRFNEHFRAAYDGSMTTWAQRRGATAVQLEIAVRHLRPESDPDRALRLYDTLQTAFGAIVSLNTQRDLMGDTA